MMLLLASVKEQRTKRSLTSPRQVWLEIDTPHIRAVAHEPEATEQM